MAYLGDDNNPMKIAPTTGAVNLPVSQGTIPWSENVSQWGGTSTTLGQKAMSASVPVAIASDQPGITVAQGSAGAMQVTINKADGIYGNFCAAVSSVASAASATDIFLIGGSATKTIRVNRLRVTGTATTAAVINILLIKRSSADSAGTNATLVPYDSFNSVATAVVQSFTSNPGTLGTSVGNVRAQKVFLPAPGSVADGGVFEHTFGYDLMQPIILRGTAQQLCVNLGGTTITGGSFSFWVEWSEQ